MLGVIVTVVLGVFFLAWNSFKFIKAYERAVVLRAGKYNGVRGDGLRFFIPILDEVTVVDMREMPFDIPPQDVITKDNVSVKINAVVYFRVVEAEKAVLQISNYFQATSQFAQTTLRSICGEATLDDLLQKREDINKRLQAILDEQTDRWGIKVGIVEVKHIDLPQDMQRAMAREAEAERERRAKIIKADGEYQASETLTKAATVMNASPLTIQLRYLETLRDISIENSSTVVFPVPLELMGLFNTMNNKKEE